MSMHLSEAGRDLHYEKDENLTVMMKNNKIVLIESKQKGHVPSGGNGDTNIPKHDLVASTINEKDFAGHTTVTRSASPPPQSVI